jgi:hypothetical protein
LPLLSVHPAAIKAQFRRKNKVCGFLPGWAESVNFGANVSGQGAQLRRRMGELRTTTTNPAAMPAQRRNANEHLNLKGKLHEHS